MLHEYRTLLPYLREHKWRYIAGLLALVVASGGQLFIPQLMRIAIDIIAGGQFARSDIVSALIWIIVISAAIAAGRFGWRYFIHGASRTIEASLRARFFTHLLTLSPEYFGRTRTGDLMARATNDLQHVRMAAGMALVAAVDGIFMTLAILVILFVRIPPRLALLTIIPLPAITLIILLLGRVISKLFKRVQEGFARLSEQTQETFAGISVVKTFVKERYFLNRFRDANQEYQLRNLKLARIWGSFMPIVGFLSGATTLLLLRFGGEAVLVDSLSPGEFVATLSYLDMLTWPMIGAGFTVNMLQRGAAALKRINAVLEERPEITSPPGAITEVASTELELRELHYEFADGTKALENVSFKVPEGCSLGILGRTGSGKSTIISMLPRFLDPPVNSVFVGGIDVTKREIGALRRQFGMVPQDSFLFSTNIRSNIAFGVDELTEDAIQRLCSIAALDRDLSIFPQGLETMVGERGVTLSGGQKQRIAIARALAINPQILILDDSLSAVDTETEERILADLLQYRKDKTTVIVSHRVSTLQRADLIVVIEAGQVSESGTHATLLHSHGFYEQVYRIQQLERTGRARA
ncbi:MAG: ABC transporter ATP-binding protein/permease [Spirochaeta sp.]|nr:ABC transporter ATP-binding protein/permease [Spirochaeta sp.]